MTIAQAWTIQTDLFAAINGAASVLTPPVPVFDHIPDSLPVEHIRMDFSYDGRDLKNCETGCHYITVHYFGAPRKQATKQRGLKRSKEVLAAVHAAIMVGRYAGSLPINTGAEWDLFDDAVSVHSALTYTVDK